MSIASLVVELSASTARFQSDMGKAVHQAERAANDIKRALGNIGAGLGLGGAGATVALFLKGAIDAQLEAEKATNRLNAVLTATGGIVGHNLQSISDYSDELAKTTQFDDEAFRTAAGTLAKFGNIHGQVFKDALKLTADYAAVAGIDVPSAAQAMGKALQSPMEGLRGVEKEIGKLGVMQKQHIENLVTAGRLAEAQGVILETLSGKIGGAAEAMNTGLNKATKDLTKSWNEMLEAFGRTDIIGGTTQGGLLSMSKILDGIKGTVEFLSRAAGGRSGSMRDLIPPKGMIRPDQFVGGFNGVGGMAGARYVSEEAQKKALDEAKAAGKKAADEARAAAKRAAAEAVAAEKRLLAEGTAGWVKYADDVFRIADEENIALAKISQEHWDYEAKMKKMDIDGWVAHAEEVFRLADEENLALAKIADQENKVSDFARGMGLAFTSALGDVIKRGGRASDVLKALLIDVAQIINKVAFLDPLEKSISKAFSSGGIGSWLSGLFKAEGGPVMAGGSYIVGERGPELFTPGVSGMITPNGAGGGVVVNQYISIDSRSDQASIRDAMAQAQRNAVMAIQNNLNRGGAIARAVGIA